MNDGQWHSFKWIRNRNLFTSYLDNELQKKAVAPEGETSLDVRQNGIVNVFIGNVKGMTLFLLLIE